ncbi:hypothetical protein FPQ18DRAFT_403645 [Pyronema domesticum]|nr:hypothetical protein FPQ18DRAFT_403645 [Pyronema domesticum]
MFESTALHPADPNADTDTWPLLELTDVMVVRYRRGHPEELVDLADVDEKGPFRVKGRLVDSGKKARSLVKNTDVFSNELTIPGVETYSMEHDTKKGTTKIWVLGSSAWYTISPSSEYRSIYENLIEKAKVWLFLQQRYKKFKGPGKEIPGEATEVYKDFLAQNPSYRTTRGASAIFTRHHRYLIFMMHRPEEDFEMWKRTPLSRVFFEEYPEVVEEAMEFHGHKPNEPLLKLKQLEVRPTPEIIDLTSETGMELDEPGDPVPGADEQDEAVSNSEDNEDEDAEDTPEASSSEEDDENAENEDCEETSSSSDSSSTASAPRRTPHQRATPTIGKTVKTVSTKGRSILRPRHSMIPLDPGSPPSPILLTSPIDAAFEAREARGGVPKRKKSSTDLSQDSLLPPKRTAPPIRQLALGTLKSESPEVQSTHWRCNLDDVRCHHIVMNAKTVAGRIAVEEHYAFHGRVMTEALKTVDSEAGGYQVNHLMEKIKAMKRDWEESRPSPLKGAAVGEEGIM